MLGPSLRMKKKMRVKSLPPPPPPWRVPISFNCLYFRMYKSSFYLLYCSILYDIHVLNVHQQAIFKFVGVHLGPSRHVLLGPSVHVL